MVDAKHSHPALATIITDPGSPCHDSASTHVTGASEYIDDRPMVHGELHCGLVYSPFAHARLVCLDTAPALLIPGVVCAVTAKDLAHNSWGSIIHDQPLLVVSEAQYVGEVVAVLGAQTKDALAKGLAAVIIEWEKLPDIRTIQAAIAAQSFIGAEREIAKGDVETALASAAHCIASTLDIGGADHFYLESQAAVVYPREDGQLEVHSSTQHPTEVQHVVAETCGLRYSDVVCIAKRLGGGFGGKESQASPIAAYAALIAQRSGQPARLILSKDDDMIITGKRNPFRIEYRCGFNAQGKILALDAMLHSDGGAYADLSTAIMERAMLHCDNAYSIEAMRVRGRVCRTNFHPHTAFRGFGGPKGVALVESIIEDIALKVGRDALDVRMLNCYNEGQDVTHYDQRVEDNRLPALFATLEHRCEYRKRREEIRGSNATRAATNAPVRGLSLTAVKFGISFTTRYLNQGNALVNVHRDGTVQVSTGAVEMGQGAHARIAMIVAEKFGIPLSSVRIMPTSTEKNANTSPTAASTGTDINGAAAALACEMICARLASLAIQLRTIPQESWAIHTAGLGTMRELTVPADADAKGTNEQRVQFAHSHVTVTDRAGAVFTIEFAELIREAFRNRISVSDYGFYSTPNLGFNKITGKGCAFLYFTQGVAASEVELNPDTGEVKVRRVDILMDMGQPINHALDMGQVTGGFIQGMGWVTTEHLVYDDNGKLLTHAPSTYKIPSVQDTPRIFNADFMRNEDNTQNIRGTKASGEPPLLLAISVWTAIRDAIHSTRTSEESCVELAIPATAERILRALSPERFAKWDARAAST